MAPKKSTKKKESYLNESDISKIKEWRESDDGMQMSGKNDLLDEEEREIQEMTIIDPSILKEPYRI